MSGRRIIILCGPSGSGKTTLAQHVIQQIPSLAFSISATTRTMRPGEKNGVDYHFISPDEFRQKIAAGEFIEWEEVYNGTYYGTLRSELERLWKNDTTPVLDIDVEGALKIKEKYKDLSLAIFVHPISIENIKSRLKQRATETAESYEKRVNRASEELDYAPRLDKVVYNDEVDSAKIQTEKYIAEFLELSKKTRS
jgi:guanylate kinase